ncbi:MAG: FtsQ-type POTRA domain-containing protein [Deltaproteobacteria bacterium]|nr:FtsQ-type POTRA domain-containing protein [Deltaproteobacteria bacterium]
MAKEKKIKSKRVSNRKSNVRRDRGDKKRSGISIKRIAHAMLIVFVVYGTVLLGGRLYSELLDAPSLSVSEIVVSGSDSVSGGELLRLGDIYAGKSILKIDTKEASVAMTSHPYVEEAKVKRQLPNKVYIDVKERKPVLLVNTDRLMIMDTKGVVFKAYTFNDAVSLPILTGIRDQEMVEQVYKEKLYFLLEAMSASSTVKLDEISEINYNPFYGLTVVMSEGNGRISFGMNDYAKKVSKLEMFISARGGNLNGVKTVDLNSKRGVVVKFASYGKEKGGVT